MAAHTRVGKIAQNVHDGATVTREWSNVTFYTGLEQIGVVRQFVMGHAGVKMMHRVIGFMEEGHREKAAQPSIGNDAPGGTSRGVPAEADMLNIFSPALKIARDDSWQNVQPKEIYP